MYDPSRFGSELGNSEWNLLQALLLLVFVIIGKISFWIIIVSRRKSYANQNVFILNSRRLGLQIWAWIRAVKHVINAFSRHQLRASHRAMLWSRGLMSEMDEMESCIPARCLCISCISRILLKHVLNYLYTHSGYLKPKIGQVIPLY